MCRITDRMQNRRAKIVERAAHRRRRTDHGARMARCKSHPWWPKRQARTMITGVGRASTGASGTAILTSRRKSQDLIGKNPRGTCVGLAGP